MFQKQICKEQKLIGALETGRADPFAEVTASSSGGNGGTPSGSGTSTSSDGTYYNSSRVK